MFSLTENSMGIIDEILANPEAIGCKVKTLDCKATVVDMGLYCKGSWKGALLFTRATMGDLGIVSLGEFKLDDRYTFSSIEMFIDQPMIACVGAQMADWRLGDGEYATIASGPARSQAVVDSDYYIHQTTYRDTTKKSAIVCLQTVKSPTDELALEIANACHVEPKDTYILVSNSTCIAASMQVSARIIEQTCNKLFRGGIITPECIVMARGNAPIAPIVKDENVTMGRINDALIYGSTVELWLDSDDETIEKVAPTLVAKHSSPCYGIPFEKIFVDAGCNFFNIPLDVHSIGLVNIHNVNSGKSLSCGEINYDVLRKSFVNEG